MEEQYVAPWWDIITHGMTTKKLDDWMSKNQISDLKFDNYIMMLNPVGQSHIPATDIVNYPYFETIPSETTALFGGENAYLVIQGSYSFHYMSEDPYPIPEDEIDISEGRYAMYPGQTYLLAKLQWGNQYWDGTEWVNYDTTFKIDYIRDDTDDDKRRADATMYKHNEFVNTVSWRIGTSERGMLIKLPEGKIMSGIPKLTVYAPYTPEYFSTKSHDYEGRHYKHSVVFLKNFGIKAIIGDPTYSDLNDSNTVYTNIINASNAKELDEIKFKICTNDNKNPNYSSVAYKDGGDYKFLEKIYNDAMTDNNVIDSDDTASDGYLKPEEWLIYRLTNQYSSPRTRLTLELKNIEYAPYVTFTDKWLPNKKFVIDSQDIDYATGRVTITLVEKG